MQRNHYVSAEDRFWSSPWAYVLLAIFTATIIGELVWLVR